MAYNSYNCVVGVMYYCIKLLRLACSEVTKVTADFETWSLSFSDHMNVRNDLIKCHYYMIVKILLLDILKFKRLFNLKLLIIVIFEPLYRQILITSQLPCMANSHIFLTSYGVLNTRYILPWFKISWNQIDHW